MCGLVGILTGPGGPPSLDRVRSMVSVLRHRGPDGYGLYRDERVALGHARLSIIDITGGDQPICNEDRTVWIAFNGEIFNYLELREELMSRGHRFSTQSDTEVIVHAFEEWGEGAWPRLNGQFAFALWSRLERQLYLVRDPVGILPLFYTHASGSVLFGSEAKALFASGLTSPTFDPVGLSQVFTRWAATPPRTVFQDVKIVPPGASVRVDADLRESVQFWWRPSFAGEGEGPARSLDDLVEELGEAMDKAISLRLRADVPVGAYLSGGLDSSLIATLIRASKSSPLMTYAIRFEDPAFDETPQQLKMAAMLGTTHHEVYCRGQDIADALPDVVWHCETPLLRTGPVPLFLLSALVRENGMKVVLTGEGADELFAGYNIFREDKVRRFWAREPDSEARPALLSRLYPYLGKGAQSTGRMWQQFFRKGLLDTRAPFYSHRIRWENTGWALRFLHEDFRADVMEPEADLAGLLPAGWSSWPPLSRAQAIEIETFMSPYLLCSQGDRVAMGHGVEVRYPFLDPGIIQFSGRLPPGRKLRGLSDKFLLRELGSRHLPTEIHQRPKQPYRAPTTTALFFDGSAAPEYVDALLSEDALRASGLVDSKASALLVAKARSRGGRMSGEREEMALVGLLTLQLLVRHFTVDFRDHLREGESRLAQVRPSVLEDLA